MNKGITLFGTTSNLKNIGLNLKKIGFKLKKFGTTWFFYIYLKKKWKGLTNVFLKLILILVTLKSSSIICLTLKRILKQLGFNLKKIGKTFNTLVSTLFLIKEYSFTLIFQRTKALSYLKTFGTTSILKKNWHKLEKSCQKLWKKLSQSENNPV